jgi:hypothetical protein
MLHLGRRLQGHFLRWTQHLLLRILEAAMRAAEEEVDGVEMRTLRGQFMGNFGSRSTNNFDFITDFFFGFQEPSSNVLTILSFRTYIGGTNSKNVVPGEDIK